MKTKVLLLVSLLGLATGCANTAKKEIPTTVVAETKKENTPATQAKPTMVDVFTCARESDVREIYIESIAPRGCKLWYSNNKTEPTAQSAKGLDYCETVHQNVRKNLESAGFKCQAVNNPVTTK